MPLVYEDEFLLKLRENFLVVEFWEKSHARDYILGITSLSLHQFYLTYRNPVILKYLTEKKVFLIYFCWFVCLIEISASGCRS